MTNWNSNGYEAKEKNPLYSGGKMLRCVEARMNVDVSALTNGDVFILARNLPLEARIHRLISVEPTPAMTAAIDNDFGFYYEATDGTLTVIDKDIVIDGTNLSSAVAQGDLLRLNAGLDRTKTIGELIGKQADEAYQGGVFFCMTMNTKATTTDRVMDLDVIVEYPTTG